MCVSKPVPVTVFRGQCQVYFLFLLELPRKRRFRLRAGIVLPGLMCNVLYIFAPIARNVCVEIGSYYCFLGCNVKFTFHFFANCQLYLFLGNSFYALFFEVGWTLYVAFLCKLQGDALVGGHFFRSLPFTGAGLCFVWVSAQTRGQGCWFILTMLVISGSPPCEGSGTKTVISAS